MITASHEGETSGGRKPLKLPSRVVDPLAHAIPTMVAINTHKAAADILIC